MICAIVARKLSVLMLESNRERRLDQYFHGARDVQPLGLLLNYCGAARTARSGSPGAGGHDQPLSLWPKVR